MTQNTNRQTCKTKATWIKLAIKLYRHESGINSFNTHFVPELFKVALSLPIN